MYRANMNATSGARICHNREAVAEASEANKVQIVGLNPLQPHYSYSQKSILWGQILTLSFPLPFHLPACSVACSLEGEGEVR